VGAAGTVGGAAGRAGTGAGSGAVAGMDGAPAPSGMVQRVSFEVLTAAQGGRYQPRNIGAIWVQSSSGQFVKSLEVWARIRQRYLTKYNAARSGMAIDVTSTATLRNHTKHSVEWDLKDRSGATVPPGKYLVFVEVTDKDATGMLIQFEIDTSQGPQTLMPGGNQYFTMMKVVLS
jgi:hypothetical protein